MANPTTNYGWPMPTSTDLVTDLPADFALFGQPVDTSLKALNPETTLGDIAYRSSTSNTNTRLGIGTNGQVLAVSSGLPAWTTTADVTPLTTKGDVFTFSTVDARIGVGANNTVLTADSAEATGLKWATPSSGMTLIKRASFSAVANTGTTFDGMFSATYDTYLMVVEDVIAVTEADDFYFQFRYAGPTTQTSANKFAQSILLFGGTETLVSGGSAAQFSLCRNTGTATFPSTGQFYISRVGNASEYPVITGTSLETNAQELTTFAGFTEVARTYTGFILSSASTNITGTVAVYGLAIA